MSQITLFHRRDKTFIIRNIFESSSTGDIISFHSGIVIIQAFVDVFQNFYGEALSLTRLIFYYRESDEAQQR